MQRREEGTKESYIEKGKRGFKSKKAIVKREKINYENQLVYAIYCKKGGRIYYNEEATGNIIVVKME